MRGLLIKYYEQLLKDYDIIAQLYHIKIVRPMALTIRQHIKIHGILKILWKIIVLVLIKVPIWWPFLMVTYLWGLLVTYSFLPLIYWIQLQIEAKTNNLPIIFYNIDYEKFLYWVLEIQWWLKTWLGLIHIFDLFYKWWTKLPRLIDFIYIKVRDKWYEIKENSMRTDGAIDIWLNYLVKNRTQIKNNLYKYFIIIPKNFVFNWLNPHKYFLFRLIFYKNNRLRLYTWLYARWLIRYKIFKGLVKYWIRSALFMGGRRLWLRIKYLIKMIGLRCHIRYLYNLVVLKIRKIVYYVSRELIYIWTTIGLLIEIMLILFAKFLFLFGFLANMLFKILYVIFCMLNVWFYDIAYTYDWYQVWFIKGVSNSIIALKIQKQLGLTAKKAVSGVILAPSPTSNYENGYLTLKTRIKQSLKNNGNKLWKLYFGPQAILFADKAKNVECYSQQLTDKKYKNVKHINEDQHIWTKIWKSCCPPLWFKKPEDVNSIKSKYRIEFKSGIGKKNTDNKSQNNKKQQDL